MACCKCIDLAGPRVSEFVLNDFLPFQLAQLSARVSREFSGLYSERFGISVPEWRLVAHLSQVEGPVSVREIYQKVGMDKSKVSRAATRLEKRGFVVKSTSDHDRRLIELRLSASGRDMVHVLTPIALAFEARFLSVLGTKSADFRAALDTLLADTGH